MSPETVRRGERPAKPWLYTPNPSFYDEMLAPDGRVRPQWHPLIERLEEMGTSGFARRWQEGRRLLHENGATYNVYIDSPDTERPWPLDPIPLCLNSSDWSHIESTIRQLATLLNAILADLYGPQKLLRAGLLPSELVFPNPDFLRPCCHVPVPGNVYLHMYAADLARSADGRWWIIANRTQAPSGAGYALENRLVCARVLPDVFRSAHIHRLAAFFQTYREALRALAPGRKDNPRIVLLTPGPYNETYFEQAFLARYLGYALVEGGDLTVRDDRVYLKTLGGLLPVDLIVRRQDDTYCDPLELRPDSMLGVPGLVQAVRSGTVTIANALGSGLVESAAPAGFLPGLSKHLLGEELKMPDVATWWCGEESALAFVAEHLSNLVVRPAFRSAGGYPIFGSRLNPEERAALIEKIRRTPAAFVAQEQVALSTVPVWEEGSIEPRHLVLRVYAVASGGSYVVMPGGLTRITSSLDDFVASMQNGGGSKDTWVAAGGPTSQFSLLPSVSPRLNISRATFDLPSRVADNLFWLGRYVERIEPAVRVARAILVRLMQDSDLAAVAGATACSHILAAWGYLANGASDAPTLSALEREVLAMVFDSEGRYSLLGNIRQVRRLGGLLRDRISADAWRILNQLDPLFPSQGPAEPLRLGAAQALLDRVIGALAAFSGVVMESMTRGDGWRFLDIGRRLERAARMVDVIHYGLGFDCEADSGHLEVLLEIADSSITYRSRYFTSMQPELVLDLLLMDEANPRSVAYQLARLREHVEQLPASRTAIRRAPESRLAISLLAAVQLTEIRDLTSTDAQGRRTNLETLLQRLAGELRSLSETLTSQYFNQAGPARRFSVP